MHDSPGLRPMWRLPLALLLTLLTGCGGASVAAEQPWFCAVQGVDHDETVRLMQRRASGRSPAAAARVLQTDDWRECWGNAALLHGAHGADPAVILARVDELAEERRDGRPLLEVDAILAGYALSARQSDDLQRIEQVVGALVERSDPAWWASRDPSSYDDRDGKDRLAAVRARSALFALAKTGTRPAERALVAMRDDPAIVRRVGDDGRTLLSDLIREVRACMDQPPGHRR